MDSTIEDMAQLREDKKRQIQRTIVREALEVVDHIGFNDEERFLWLEYLTFREENEIASLEREADDMQILLDEMTDEDGLWTGQVSAYTSENIKTCERAFSCPCGSCEANAPTEDDLLLSEPWCVTRG